MGSGSERSFTRLTPSCEEWSEIPVQVTDVGQSMNHARYARAKGIRSALVSALQGHGELVLLHMAGGGGSRRGRDVQDGGQHGMR